MLRFFFSSDSLILINSIQKLTKTVLENMFLIMVLFLVDHIEMVDDLIKCTFLNTYYNL